MNGELKKKNVLDLQFQKYLVIASTSMIIVFTYFVGVIIAILTKHIPLNDYIVMSVLFIISVSVVGICSILFFNVLFHLKNILDVIKRI